MVKNTPSIKTGLRELPGFNPGFDGFVLGAVLLPLVFAERGVDNRTSENGGAGAEDAHPDGGVALTARCVGFHGLDDKSYQEQQKPAQEHEEDSLLVEHGYFLPGKGAVFLLQNTPKKEFKY